jgi:peptidoglycan/LPS O-acetylase OafA/YrhL
MSQWIANVSIICAIFVPSLIAASLLSCTRPTIHFPSDVMRAPHFELVDGLRGLLALAVFSHHALITSVFVRTGLWRKPDSTVGTQLGQSSVALFFMITAFLFWTKVLQSRQNFRWRAFFIKRLFRLAPLYAIVVLWMAVITIACAKGQVIEPLKSFAEHLIQWLTFTIYRSPNVNLVPETGLIIGGVAWTLRYEWAFYIALPMFAAASGVGRWRAAALSGCAVVLFRNLSQLDPLAYDILSAFLGGGLAACWVRRNRLRLIAQTLWFGSLALLCVSVVLLTQEWAYNSPALGALTIFFVAVVSGNPVFSWLGGRQLNWLGNLSYGIYLCHGMVLWLLSRQVIPRLNWLMPISDVAYLVWLGCGVFTVLVVAYGLNIYVERPFIRLGEKLGRLGYAAKRLP